MARRARPRRRRAQSGTTPGNEAEIHSILDPLSSLLKSAGLRQSEPSKAPKEAKKKAAAKPKAAARSAKSKSVVRSPLAVPFPVLPTIAGVKLTSVAAGIKYQGRRDLMVASFDAGTQVAGVFTTSKCAAPSVDWCRKCLDNDNPEARVLIVNSGNANAFTGKDGEDAVKEIASVAAKAANCRQRDIFMCSTGVIGNPLPVRKIATKLPSLIKGASARPWQSAAQAIMTTDTFPKGSTRKVEIDGVPVTINGFAKGSGMIAPDLATMLGFIFTDADIPSAVLQALLLLGTRDSFNAITVDSDTSTSDTVLAFATRKAKLEKPVTRPGDRRLAAFRTALFEVMHDLAIQIVKDGEGATKLVEVNVTGAASPAAAKKIARSIADSPLVKTAVAGEDPNWGRIVMAVGKAGEEADRDKLVIKINDLPVAEKGQVHPDYVESKTAASMKREEIKFEVDVGVGRGEATIWTCDFTDRYISINADYRS